jgi:uncharacterized protein (TIGR02594 family)
MTKWIDEARKHIGKREIKGVASNLWIKAMWFNLKAGWLWNTKKDDSELPWCGLFTGHCLDVYGYAIPKEFYRALDWLKWGVDIGAPCYGCVVVFTRNGGGHVGFVVGMDKKGRLMVLGGNQKDAVTIAPFDIERVSGYRMPVGTFHRGALPTLASHSSSSTNEA